MEHRSDMIFCRLCLRVGLTQKYILSDNLERIFIESFFKENGFPEMLDDSSYSCFECRILLHKSYNFLQKALKAQKLLAIYKSLQLPLTYSSLKSLDRNKSGISSKLTHSSVETYLITPRNCPDNNIKIEPSDDNDVSNTKQYITDIFKEEDSNINAIYEDYDPLKLIKEDEPIEKETKNVNNKEPHIMVHNNLEDFTKEDEETEEILEDNDEVVVNVLSLDVKKKKQCKIPDVSSPNVANIVEKRFRTRKVISYKGLDDFEPGGKDKDKEFVAMEEDSMDDSAEESDDSYDEKGNVIKRRKDNRIFPMNCEECDGIVTSRSDHNYHYQLMHRDKPYPYRLQNKQFICPHCGERVSGRMLKVHEDRHSGKKFACEDCRQLFNSHRQMLEHKRRKHAPTRPWVECDYCSKKMFHKSDLRLHIRIHTGEKPFECNLCKYKAAHKGNILAHARQFHKLVKFTNPLEDRKSPKKEKRKVRKRSGRDSNCPSKSSKKRNAGKRKSKKITRRKRSESHSSSEDRPLAFWRDLKISGMNK